jgi:pilus assembly protein CpaB
MVLLQRVLVLAVGQKTALAAGGPELRGRNSGLGDRLLTLSLSLPEAQLLSLALEKGRLSVAVRNTKDPAVQTDVPDVNSSALFTGRQRPEARAAPKKTANGPIALGARQ